MTGRDRIVLIAIVVLGDLGRRLDAGRLARAQGSQQPQHTGRAPPGASSRRAEGQLADARAAQSQYSAAYASVVSLGKAVPAEPGSAVADLPARTGVQPEAASTSTRSSPDPAAARAPLDDCGQPRPRAGFTQMPFTFVFNGGFFSLEHLFRQLTAFTTHTGSGGLQVSGRLLTIQSVKLAPAKPPRAGKAAEADRHDHGDRLRAARQPGPHGRGDRDARRRGERAGLQLRRQLPDRAGRREGDTMSELPDLDQGGSARPAPAAARGPRRPVRSLAALAYAVLGGGSSASTGASSRPSSIAHRRAVGQRRDPRNGRRRDDRRRLANSATAAPRDPFAPLPASGHRGTAPARAPRARPAAARAPPKGPPAAPARGSTGESSTGGSSGSGTSNKSGSHEGQAEDGLPRGDRCSASLPARRDAAKPRS